MALHCSVLNLCFNRSLQTCWFSSYKIALLYRRWYLARTELPRNSRNNHSGNDANSPDKTTTSSIILPEDPKGRPYVTDDMIKDDVVASQSNDVPEEPTTCCMSGCANCVWIEYAEELSKRFKDGGEKARESIMKISDPNMRAFLLTELKTLDKS
ncbi:UPF0651 protein YPL107W, mitochondrial [Ischnura elegans]|uniref:UPF0651 protein YPL107W, mitochondrial n=1 Tax=Ischnura elegans TaxID=197161 RepID=UPI001ED87F30|nr:UPF0651 protein YPL107W, mitochondrial [Ischnura elegans]